VVSGGKVMMDNSGIEVFRLDDMIHEKGGCK
jgi:hypothetical protein